MTRTILTGVTETYFVRVPFSSYWQFDNSNNDVFCGTTVDEPGKRAADTFLINEKPATDCEIISKQRPSVVVRGNLK